MSQPSPTLAFVTCLLRRRASRARMNRYRDAHLRKVLAHTAERVTFYQKRWAEAGADVSTIRTVADLARLPPVERSVLRAEPMENLIARGAKPDEFVRHHTGGTSGRAFEMIHSVHEIRVLRSFMFRVFSEHGRGGHDLLSRLWRGPEHQRPQRFARKLLDRLGLYLRKDLKWPQDPAGLAEDLLKLRPTLIEAPPVAMIRAGERLGPDGIAKLGVRKLFCEGEWLSGSARRCIEETWRAPVVEIFGATELYVVAWTCPDCGLLHTCDDSVIVEVLREDGQPAQPGERGELVATALHGFVVPMIRYRTGDLVIQGEPKAPCGRPFGALARILGRRADLIPLAGAPALHPSDMDAVFADAAWVREFQLHVLEPGRVDVHVVSRRDVTEEERARVERKFRERLGPFVQGAIRIVPEIPLGDDEKMRLVVREERKTR